MRLVGEIQAQRIDEVKFLLSLTNKTDQSFDNVFAYDIKSIQKQPAMDVPIQYRDEPQNIHKSQDDEEYHGAVQVRQGFIVSLIIDHIDDVAWDAQENRSDGHTITQCG